MRLFTSCRHFIVLISAAIALVEGRANALQPLDAFVASAKQKNPDNREAAATARQRTAQRDVATAAYLPSFTAQGVYTHNQFPAEFTLPGTTDALVITPQNGVDAYFTVAVPLINIGAWQQRKAARITAQAAAASVDNTEVSVESSVAQAYYQYLGSEAVRFSANKSLEVVQQNVKTVQDRKDLGTASDLDIQRAVADVARAQQDVASAEQDVIQAARSLETLSRLTPEPATAANYVPDDLHEEAPLNAWLRKDNADLVAVRPAVLSTQAADASRTAAQDAWFPTLAGQGQEHITNAGGFTGHYEVYTATATATWKFDFSLAPAVAVQTAALSAAQAREDKARRAADDAIFQAWNQVRLDIEKARAARAQVKATTLAQDLAHDRYNNGVATQLEVVQAQRDFFQAAVSQAQADFDLQYARALLRLSARRSDEEKTR